ncbi:sugar nucleotide-binding protein [Catenovulum sediminis]|uniref:sugar nucleotide-binding protein n=1 Tax=Catenovulum sediminis TaxID=1740262 RepID=UPI00163DCE5F|nr:sugar nucleotide-binding protein [Catenovulum sediminis]
MGANSFIGRGILSTQCKFDRRLVSAGRQEEVDCIFDLEKPDTWDEFSRYSGGSAILLSAITPQNSRAVNVEKVNFVNNVMTVKLIEKLDTLDIFPIFVSTNLVFGRNTYQVPFDALYSPQSLYAENKVYVESYLREQKQNFAIVRLSKVISKDFPLFLKWASAICSGQDVEAYYDHYFCPILLDDVSRVLIEIAKTKQTGVYQLSGMADVTYYDVAKIIHKNLGRRDGRILPVSASYDGQIPTRYSSLLNRLPPSLSITSNTDLIIERVANSIRDMHISQT